MIELIIFDWDDVFTTGSKEGYYKCYHEALRGVGVLLEPEETDRRIKAKWGAGHAAQLEYLLQEQPDLIPHAIKLYEQHFFGDTFVDCLEVVPGCQELVNELSINYRLAIATGGHPEILKERILPKFHFPDVFTQIVTIYDSNDISHAKPDPYMINKILETQQIASRSTVMVGDAENDVIMARAAGVEPIVVLTGHLDKQQAEDLKVRHIIDDVTQLETILSKLAAE